MPARPPHHLTLLLLSLSLSIFACEDDMRQMMAGGAAADMGPLAAVPLNAFQLRGYIDSYYLTPEDRDLIEAWPEWDFSRPNLRRQAGTQALRLFDLDYRPNSTNNEVFTEFNELSMNGHCGTTMYCFDELLAHFQINRHPDHGPLVMLLRPSPIRFQQGPYMGEQVAARKVAVLERVLHRELGPERIFRPNELQGDHPSLRAAVEAEGWPSTADLAGRFILVLLDEGEARRHYRERFGWFEPYAVEDNPMMFTLADGPDDPHGVFATLPADATDAIEAYAAAGIIVHVDVAQHTFEPAQQAGAHLFTAMELDEVPFDTLPARCNPVTGPMLGCRPEAYETPHPAPPAYPPNR